MEKNYVKTVLEGLKSSSSSRVQDSLLKIRSKIITNDDGIKLFTECGGLNYVVPHLRKPNERILGLALSILGNCGLNEECRIEMGKLRVFSPLILVLKTVSRDSIVGRACRVVGNIAQNRSNAEELHLYGAVPALVTLIKKRDKNTSYPTLTMAVRAIRQLWIVIDKRMQMLSEKAVRWVAMLLIRECESAGMLKPDNPETSGFRKSQEELISGILKCLAYLTTHGTTDCGIQAQGDGRGFQCLVSLIKTYESLALRCLMNLCFLPSCRPLLGSAGLVECLISILQKSPDTRWWESGTARTLAQLSGEAVNRARVRRAGGLPLLLAAARHNSCAMRALVHYVFDDTSFQMLVNDGLVGLLIDELKDCCMTMNCDHDYIDPVKKNEPRNNGCCNKLLYDLYETIDSDGSDSQNENETSQTSREPLKRSRSKSPNSSKKRSRPRGADVYWDMKSERDEASASRSPMSPGSDGASGFSPERRGKGRRARCDQSPESGFSTGEGSAASPPWTEYQWSPGSSSGPTSPFSVVNDESSDSEVSGRYSPVCSEHEPEPDAAASAALDAAQLALDGLDMYDPDTYDDEVPFVETAKRELAGFGELEPCRTAHAMALLFRVANGSYEECGPAREPLVPSHVLDQLTGQDCLNTLLDYTEKCQEPMGKPARILHLIFGNPLCLSNILQHKILLRLHKLCQTTQHPVDKCKQCKQLQKFYGKLMTRLTILAEAPYGVGEICFNLIRGPSTIRDTLAMTLPYIVQSKAILKKYYVEFNALTGLLAALPDSGAEFEHYVTALAKLSTNVRIKDPKLLENRYSGHVFVSYDPIIDGLAAEEIVTFELDDMSTVTANRTFLCQNSEVFNAMLKGCFKESIEESVKIKNVTKDALEYLLMLLNCGLNDTKCHLEVFPLADKLETNLEVLLLADRFLLEKLKILLNSAILQFKMAPNTADKIYAWSLSDGMGFLCVESVAYILTGQMSATERSRAFRNILSLEYKEQWLDDVKSVIIRHLEKWA